MKQEFYPTDMESDMRIDKYLSESCPELSRSYIQKLLKSGQVLVNKKGVKASYVVSEDDHIELEVPAAVEPEIEAEAMDLDILYEDQDIILINKPKGMVVHPAAGCFLSQVSYLLSQLQSISENGISKCLLNLSNEL